MDRLSASDGPTQVNSGPHVLQQKAFFDSVRNSPHVVAQRQRMESLFGAPVQRRETEELPGEPETAQRVAAEASVSQRENSPGSPAPFATPEPKPNNTGLPDGLKSGVESLSGMSLDNVKVHYNSSQPAQLNALAYAQGTDIHVAPGQEQHLPHEAWHIVQQAQGRVKPTMQMTDGVPVNDDAGLEHEADAMGAKALQMRNHPDEELRSTGARQPALQRMTARVRREEGRAPTAQEIAAARASGVANSRRLAGHGRKRHGRKVETPAGVQAQQAAADRQAAIDQAIQLKARQGAGPARPAHAPNNTGLPDGLKSGVESLSGLSLDNVKVHYNSPQPVQLNALAYAQGGDIHVAPGQEKHLPHEAWHVVQQAQGRVKPTMQAKDVSINDDAALEQEAHLMGAKALQMTSKDQVTFGLTLLQRREEAVSPFRVQVAGLDDHISPPQSAIPAIQRRVKPDRAIDPDGLNVVGESHTESEAREGAPEKEKIPEEKNKVWYTPSNFLPKGEEDVRFEHEGKKEYGDLPHLRLMFILENLQSVC